MRSLKYFVLSLSVILLFSCASSKVATVETKEEVVQENAENSADLITEEELVEEEEEETQTEIDVSGYVASDEKSVKKTKKNKNGNIHTPMYQRVEKEVVETKKILIKPVTDLTNDTRNFTKEEINTFFNDIKKNNILDESKEYTSESVKILMENYKNILQVSSICCATNITENLKMSGLQSEEVVSILSKDAKEGFIQDRCLIASKEDIEEAFDKNVSNMVLKAREVCICNNKDYLRKNISNFYRLYNKDPKFYEKIWIYRYKDRQGDIVEDDVNGTILNIAVTLESCP